MGPTDERGASRETRAPQWRRLLALRLAGTAAGIAGGLLLLPDDSRTWVFALIVGAIYLPISLALHLTRTENPRPPGLAWALTLAADVTVVSTVLALFPAVGIVAFLGLVLIVIVNGQFWGSRWGLVVAGVAWAAVLVPSVVTTPSRIGAFEAVFSGPLLGAVGFVVGSLADDERRSAERARRLADAIASVGSTLDLGEVLAGLCRAACRAMDARFAVVLSREQGSLAFAAGTDAPTHLGDAAEHLERLLSDPALADAPTPKALRTGRTVLEHDLEGQPVVTPFNGLIREAGIRSMAAVPIVLHGEPVAVLNVYLPRPHRFSAPDVRFLDAIGEHAAIAMERSMLYSREKETADRLRDLDRLKSEFVATVSHELRTPLTGIVGFALMLRNRWRQMDADLRDEVLERVEENARSLEHLITHLLDFSRLERGQFRVELGPHDPLELVRKVLQNMSIELDGFEVRVDADEGVPEVSTDPYAFERILGNLLSNAAKFSAPGSPIDVVVRADDGEVCVSVRDHGKGIPEGDLPRIWDRFYRGEAAGTRGAGIGLTVVKELAELMGGRAEAANAEGGAGAVFTVRLPRAGTADRPDEPVPGRSTLSL